MANAFQRPQANCEHVACSFGQRAPWGRLRYGDRIPTLKSHVKGDADATQPGELLRRMWDFYKVKKVPFCVDGCQLQEVLIATLTFSRRWIIPLRVHAQ